MRPRVVAAGDRACLFDGAFDHTGVPMARLIAEGEPWIRLWADFSDRFLDSEPAKPFHFGMVTLREAEAAPEIWGWSYRKASFWRDETGVFDLAYAYSSDSGYATADCRASP